MRLWSLHPRYLDRQGLVALWREGLLAQKVLQGKTRGYRHHPQLERFKEHPAPCAAIAEYLRAVHDEAVQRGYRFDGSKIVRRRTIYFLTVTSGQLAYELRHLRRKLEHRAPADYARIAGIARPRPHPLFRVVRGGIAIWERPVSPT